MRPFEFQVAGSIQAAAELSAAHEDAMLLGGGTTMADLMKLEVLTPRLVIDINSIDNSAIAATDSGVLIGANARMSDVASHAFITRQIAAVSEALLLSASPQIRNMATIGGNLMQRTRCPYYREVTYVCNKRNPGSGCDAIGGVDRLMAVLGTSDKCIATHPSDLAVALVALDAMIHVRGVEGERTIPIREFYICYGDDPAGENVLREGELITAVELKTSAAALNSHYLKIRERASYEFALASAAVALEIEGSVVRRAHVALGGVGTRPWHAPEAERILTGQPATREVFTRAADAALQSARPQTHNGFKINLAKRTLVRALEHLAAHQRPAWYEHGR